jgi:hypothetical protein
LREAEQLFLQCSFSRYCRNRTEEQIFAALECDAVGMLQATFVLQTFEGVVALWDFDNWQEVVG